MTKINMDTIVEGAIVGLAGEGVWRILKERVRVLNRDPDYSREHDDMHDRGELLRAAEAYIAAARYARVNNGELMPYLGWPWEQSSWNPDSDPIRNLERAGQLIAAEIDRLERQK